jgi:hypothetical protein
LLSHHIRNIYFVFRSTYNMSMKALNYKGPYQVKVEEVGMPKLEHPDDIIVKVTTVSTPRLWDLTLKYS